MDYSIGEFSKITGLGIHTLRYYEQEGLIFPARNKSNRRRYSDGDIVWAEFIKRLKNTGMPVKEIARYAAFRREGEGTLSARMEMLIRHKNALENQKRELTEHMRKLEEKIDWYRRELARLS